MSDTTTTLFPGSGGDVMDEEQITQGDGTTLAKRPRVVITGTTGASIASPVAADPGASPYALPTLAVALVSDNRPSGYVDGELRALSATSDGRLRVASSAAFNDLDFFGSDVIDMTDHKNIFTSISNPWGF